MEYAHEIKRPDVRHGYGKYHCPDGRGQKTKVTKAVKAQKALKYKQDAWKDLNKQIVNLYNKSLTNMRFESSYKKKVTKVSNSSIVSVITGENAMNSVQSLKVSQLARSGYLTGG